MMIGLLASLVCVARTDVCAPAGSKVEGSITQNGGQVIITPSAPMVALGAAFRAGTRVLVSVLPWWSSDKSSGAIVHVGGELDRETVVSGVRLAGTIRIGQIQGRPSQPQLVEASDIKGGRLTVSSAGTVDVAPGMRIQGNVDIGSVRIEITSPTPVHALGLDLDAGVVRIDQRDTGYSISGTLSHAQEIGGVLVERQVDATLEAGHPRFATATLARATPLQALGLPDGEAPTGTLVRMDPAATQLFGPVTVCGIALVPIATLTRPAVTFTTSGPPPQVAVTGALAATDVEVGGGVHMSGSITLHYATASCQRLGLEGTLARAAEQLHLHFAAKTAFAIFDQTGEQIVRGTLARPEDVDGLSVTGALIVRATTSGVHVIDATVAKVARFEDWEVPAGTNVDRSGDGWSFTVPRGRSARSVALHRGERVDEVSEAGSDSNSTTFTLRRPHPIRGTTLAFRSFGIDHQTGCLLGDVATAQHFGIFALPAGGNATVCGTTVVAAEGTFAVPSLGVGNWFATSAVAGTPDAPPAQKTPSRSSATVAGYWLQINSLCQGSSGIPLPPPPQRWIWVDLKGQPANEPDRRELATSAAKPGTKCPVTRCCVP